MNEQQLRELIRDELAHFIRADKYVFDRHVQFGDAKNISLGGNKGTQIGTETTHKLALWGASPVVQPASANQAALSLVANVLGADTVTLLHVNNNFAAIQTLVNQLRTDLIAAGIIKGSA